MSRYAAVHAHDKLAGPRDARPTAQDIIKDYAKEGALKGQNILITGVSSGIGGSTAIALATTGATLFLAGRSISKAKAALPSLADSPNVHFLTLDLSSEASVKAFAAEFLKQSGGKVNIVINNAGGIRADYALTVDGVEEQLAINYLNPFLLFALIKDALLAAASANVPSRFINLSSIGHRYGTIQFDNINLKDGAFSAPLAYGQAKTASIYMASEIDRRYGAQNLHAWSVHPGAILESAFLANSGWDADTIKASTARFPDRGFKSNDQGAATTVWAAVSDDVLAEGAKGKYLEDCQVAKHKDEAEKADIMAGYVDHAYDGESAKRLWEVSEEMLGVKV